MSWVRYAGAIAFFAVAGCTAVLGIQKAELEDAGSASSSMTTMTSTISGAKGPDLAAALCLNEATRCFDCLSTKCELDTCLNDEKCRRALWTYASCLDQNCQDKAEDKCAEDFATATSVGLCMAQECRSACSAGRPVTTCELYCSCMQQNCNDDYKGATLGGSFETCKTFCGKWTDRDARCHWDHCEFATITPIHCTHATGAKELCDVRNFDKPVTCATGQETGFPCRTGSECCSGNCPALVCTGN